VTRLREAKHFASTSCTLTPFFLPFLMDLGNNHAQFSKNPPLLIKLTLDPLDLYRVGINQKANARALQFKMDRAEILSTLSTPYAEEPPQTASVRQKAHSLISAHPPDDTANLPTLLLGLLSQIIKPLFTTTKHPHLTPTGRKNLVAPPPPSIAKRFLNEGDTDSAPWKTQLTIPLLRYILKAYSLLPFLPPDDLARKTAIEAHFHLLIPALLNMIDDAAPTPWKSAGCSLLTLLCEILVSTQAEILKRSGLADVFVDALKADFLLLPTLTPEEESLEVLGALYPAFLAVTDARFVKLVAVQQGTWVGEKPGSGDTWATGEDLVRYQDMLTLVYRHGVMASLEHLAASSESFSNTN
jgi:hypothetical protein